MVLYTPDEPAANALCCQNNTQVELEQWNINIRSTLKSTKNCLYSDLSSWYFVQEEQNPTVKWQSTALHWLSRWWNAIVPENWSCVSLLSETVCHCDVHCLCFVYLCHHPPWHWTLPIVQEVENGRIRRRMSDINRAGAFHLLAAIKYFLCCWWITEWVDRWMDEHWCFLCSFLLFHSKFTQLCLFYSCSPDLESYSFFFPLGLPLCAGYLSLLLRLWTCVSVSLWVFVLTTVTLGNFPLHMM